MTLVDAIKVLPLLQENGEGERVVRHTVDEFLKDKKWYVSYDGKNDEIVIKKNLLRKVVHEYYSILTLWVLDLKSGKHIPTSVREDFYCTYPIIGEEKDLFKVALFYNNKKIDCSPVAARHLFNVFCGLHDWVQEKNPLLKAYADKQKLLQKELMHQSIH